jgi:hypothetical protein
VPAKLTVQRLNGSSQRMTRLAPPTASARVSDPSFIPTRIPSSGRQIPTVSRRSGQKLSTEFRWVLM